jgi:hypothetical protein
MAPPWGLAEKCAQGCLLVWFEFSSAPGSSWSLNLSSPESGWSVKKDQPALECRGWGA